MKYKPFIIQCFPNVDDLLLDLAQMSIPFQNRYNTEVFKWRLGIINGNEAYLNLNQQ